MGRQRRRPPHPASRLQQAGKTKREEAGTGGASSLPRAVGLLWSLRGCVRAVGRAFCVPAARAPALHTQALPSPSMCAPRARPLFPTRKTHTHARTRRTPPHGSVPVHARHHFISHTHHTRKKGKQHFLVGWLLSHWFSWMEREGRTCVAPFTGRRRRPGRRRPRTPPPPSARSRPGSGPGRRARRRGPSAGCTGP